MSEIAPSTRAPSAWSDEAYRRFWHRMGAIFGRPWYEQNGPEANDAWRAGLANIPLDRAAAALQHFTISGDAYPPNLSVFVKTAREIKLYRQEKALPKPAPAPQVVEQAFTKMRADAKRVRRNVFLPGESLHDYQEALLQSGMPKDEFDAQRLIKNGWTAKNEEGFRCAAALTRFVL